MDTDTLIYSTLVLLAFYATATTAAALGIMRQLDRLRRAQADTKALILALHNYVQTIRTTILDLDRRTAPKPAGEGPVVRSSLNPTTAKARRPRR